MKKAITSSAKTLTKQDVAFQRLHGRAKIGDRPQDVGRLQGELSDYKGRFTLFDKQLFILSS